MKSVRRLSRALWLRVLLPYFVSDGRFGMFLMLLFILAFGTAGYLLLRGSADVRRVLWRPARRLGDNHERLTRT